MKELRSDYEPGPFGESQFCRFLSICRALLLLFAAHSSGYFFWAFIAVKVRFRPMATAIFRLNDLQNPILIEVVRNSVTSGSEAIYPS